MSAAAPPPAELPPLSNLVFMGMGEPADNAAVVRRAVDVLCDGRRFGFSPTKVTVSTVAPTRFAPTRFASARLA